MTPLRDSALQHLSPEAGLGTSTSGAMRPHRKVELRSLRIRRHSTNVRPRHIRLSLMFANGYQSSESEVELGVHVGTRQRLIDRPVCLSQLGEWEKPFWKHTARGRCDGLFAILVRFHLDLQVILDSLSCTKPVQPASLACRSLAGNHVLKEGQT